jgi:hypothetical protein
MTAGIMRRCSHGAVRRALNRPQGGCYIRASRREPDIRGGYFFTFTVVVLVEAFPLASLHYKM